MNTDNLIRLLRLTADNKSPVIQDLRNEIVKYVNETEQYVSQLETDNFQLFVTLGRDLTTAIQHEELLRSMLLTAYQQELNAN